MTIIAKVTSAAKKPVKIKIWSYTVCDGVHVHVVWPKSKIAFQANFYFQNQQPKVKKPTLSLLNTKQKTHAY